MISAYVPESEEEATYLAAYDPTRFAPNSTTVDVVFFTIRNGKLSVLLVERGGYPYRGAWALPGGFVEEDEDLDEAAARELMEETDVEVFTGHLEQLGTYAKPGRDPRMRVTSVAYLAFAPNGPEPTAGSDAAGARWWAVDDLGIVEGIEVDEVPRLAFDHAQILKDALDRARAKLEYTPLATAFVGERFTLTELRRVYEAVWGTEIQPANFRRKVLSTPGFVVPENATLPSGPGRPAALYRRGNASLLHPALLSPYTRAGAGLLEDTTEEEEKS